MTYGVTRGDFRYNCNFLPTRAISAVAEDVSTKDSSVWTVMNATGSVVPFLCDSGSGYKIIMYSLMPMTYLRETDTSFLVPFSGTGFWYICHGH